MTIPITFPGQLIPLIDKFGSHLTWQNTSTAVNTLEATFYASVNGGAAQTGKLVNWIRETSIHSFNKIQSLFSLANLGFATVSALKLFGNIQEHYNFSIAKDGYRIWALKTTGITSAVALSVLLGLKVVGQFSTPNAKPQIITKEETLDSRIGRVKINHTVDIRENFSGQQTLAGVLHMTNLVLDLANAYFVKSQVGLVISLASLSYRLWKNSQLKWITFTRIFPYQSRNFEVPITELKATYHMLALRPNQAETQEGCSICLENKISEPVNFCANHVFCKSCIAGVVHEKSKNFVNADCITKLTTNHYRDGVYDRTSYAYSIKIDQRHLPDCPLCRASPPQNSLSIEVTDRSHGKFDASIDVTRPPQKGPYLNAKLYAIYNIAQSGLELLKVHPRLFATIYKIQRVLLVTDFIGYALTVYTLLEHVNAKFNPDNSLTFKIATVAAVALTGLLSWHIMLQINLYMKSAIILKDVLNQMGHSNDDLKNLAISINVQAIDKVMQTLLISRIITSTALTFFSKQKKTALLTVAAQLASLNSTFQWTEVVVAQILRENIQKFLGSASDYSTRQAVGSLKSLNVTHSFLVHSSCFTHLQSTMKSITDFTVNFFKGSSWLMWTSIRSYSVTLQNSTLKACGCTLTPHLIDTTIKAVDMFDQVGFVSTMHV